MAEEHHKAVESGEEVEVQDRGLFDFLGKKKEEEKKEECHEEVLVAGVEKIHIEGGEMVEEKKEAQKKEGLLGKLHRSHSSSSSSSSDEEEAEGENKEKKKNKKGLKAKIKENLGCEKEEVKKPEVQVEEEEVVVVAAVVTDEDTAVVVEKVEEETVKVEFTPEEDKKGFLEKIKEKLPGHKKPAEEVPAPATPPAVPAEHGKEHEAVECHEGKEKKGILGKIMEKLPGYHKTEEKEWEKCSPTH